jgi:hypothetical protein
MILSGRPDLNRGPLAPHASALAKLRHAPFDSFYGSAELPDVKVEITGAFTGRALRQNRAATHTGQQPCLNQLVCV